MLKIKEKLKAWVYKPQLIEIVLFSEGTLTEVKVVLSPANVHWRTTEKISDMERT